MRELIWSAKENGADIVKGQIIFSEDLAFRPRFEEGFVEENGVRKAVKRPYFSELERLRALDLAEDDYRFFVEEAHRAGILPMMAVFSRNRVGLAASLGCELVKVASYDCASFPMLEELSGKFNKLIVSTGASFDEEIKEAALLLKESNKTFDLLHCVTSYPNTLEMANLARMKWLAQFTPEVGWSDHTLVSRDGIKAAKVALMLGAEYIERHFTVLPADKTKDGPVSITPALLKELSLFSRFPKEDQGAIVVKEIPEWRAMLGQPVREMTHMEMLNRDYYRGRFASFKNGEWIFNWDNKKNAYKILNTIPGDFSEKGKEILSSLGETDYSRPTQSELEEKISDYDILFVQLGLNVNQAVIDKGKKLKLIVTTTTGLDHIDVNYAKSRGIEVLSLRGETAFLDTISGTAELAFGLIIDLMRNTHASFQSVKNYEWNTKKFCGYNLYGKTLGIVGLGRLGKMMARFGNAFKMKVLAVDPDVTVEEMKELNCEKVDFENLLRQADAVSVHVHLAPETENMFNAEVFEKMKKSAYLINTSRGKIVNENDVLESLKNKTIAGYAADVLAGELDFGKTFSNHPLVEYAKQNNNLIIVPHIGGMTYESREATDVFMALKLKQFLTK